MMQSAPVRELPTERKARGLKGFPGRDDRVRKTAEPKPKRPIGPTVRFRVLPSQGGRAGCNMHPSRVVPRVQWLVPSQGLGHFFIFS